MKRVFVAAAAATVIGGIVGLFWFLLQGVNGIAVLDPKGVVAASQRDVLYLALALSALVVLPVFAMLVLFSVRYRAGNSKSQYKPDWGENKVLETLWWGIPIAIISVLGVVTFQTSHSLDPYKPIAGGTPLEVQVVALQWKWLFIYPEQDIATLNQLPIPVDRPVRFTMTADAPMSAFWIPSLGSQIYAMNGMESELNLKATETGDYTGYTTNINGEGYAKMTFVTKVRSEAEFEQWVAAAKKENTVLNKAVYESLRTRESVTESRTYADAEERMFKHIMGQTGHGAMHEGHTE